MAHTEKSAPDWERIEADYRAGLLSVREIAASQGITHGAINKRAKRDGWTRDLSAKIKAKADALVSKREVSSAVSTESGISERVIVEANAEVIAQIRLGHRSDIARSRKVAMSLLAELEFQTDNLDLLEQLRELLHSPDEKGQDKRDEVFRKVISLGSRSSTMKTLAETLKALISLEREAYGIGDQQQGGGGVGDLLRDIAAMLPD